MRVRVGLALVDLSPGGDVETPPNTVHGFVNTGDEPLVAEVDPVYFAVMLDGLIRDGQVSQTTGLPPLSLQALLLQKRFPEAMAQPGLGGLPMKPLAVLGQIRRFPTHFPD